MTRDEFKRCMAMIVAAFDKFDFTQEKGEVWFIIAKDYSFNEFQKAVYDYIKNESYAPSGIAMITKYIENKDSKDIVSAELAWGIVEELIGRFGISERYSWSEERGKYLSHGLSKVEEVLSLLKEYRTLSAFKIIKSRLVGMLEEDKKWAKKEFIERYLDLKDDKLIDQTLKLDLKGIVKLIE